MKPSLSRQRNLLLRSLTSPETLSPLTSLPMSLGTWREVVRRREESSRLRDLAMSCLGLD